MSKVTPLKKVEERRLPLVPAGYKLLIALLPAEDISKGGIIIPDNPKDREQTASIIGNVVAMGDMAYLDEVKFPTGPWCKLGDWIVMRSYSGIRLKIGDQEFRIINDDTVDGVVSDPRLVKRA